MNAQSQFTRSPFQAYYTVISKSFLLLGIASPAILAAVPCKGGEEVRLSSLQWFITPQHLRFALVLHLFVFPVFLSLCFASFWLAIFIHLKSWRAVHRLVVHLCLHVRVCVFVWRDKSLKVREFKSCIPKTAAFQTQDAQQDNFFSVKGTNTENASWISDYHFLSRKKIWMNSPWILIGDCFMVAPTSWLEQILCSKQSIHGKL